MELHAQSRRIGADDTNSQPESERTLALHDLHQALAARALRRLRRADRICPLLLIGQSPAQIRVILNLDEKQYNRAAELIRCALLVVAAVKGWEEDDVATWSAEWMMVVLPKEMRLESRRLVANAEKVAALTLEGYEPPEVKTRSELSDEDYRVAGEWLRVALGADELG